MFDPTCPFCPGNEAELPGLIAESKSDQNSGWRMRVVPNKFPTVSLTAAFCKGGEAFYETAVGYGSHEVLIESPHHDRDMKRMTDEEVCAVIEAYLGRHEALMARAAVRSVVVFRNRGQVAGASLQHPHSQIVGLHMVPPLIRTREALMCNYHQRKKRCLLCDIVTHEQRTGSHIIAENDAFVSFVPFAASVPYEVWIVPKRHQADFGTLHRAEIRLLAVAQRDALLRLERGVDDPPYNYVIDTASKGSSDAPHLHWCLRLLPQTTIPGGFEIGSELAINPSLPEDDAAMLRSSLPAMTGI